MVVGQRFFSNTQIAHYPPWAFAAAGVRRLTWREHCKLALLGIFAWPPWGKMASFLRIGRTQEENRGRRALVVSVTRSDVYSCLFN